MDIFTAGVIGVKGLLTASFLECTVVEFDEVPQAQQTFIENVIQQDGISQVGETIEDVDGNLYKIELGEDGFLDWHIVDPTEQHCIATPFTMGS